MNSLISSTSSTPSFFPPQSRADSENTSPRANASPSTSSLLPPNVTLSTCSIGHIPSLRRITSLLLPIRYPDKFYTAIVNDPEIRDLTRVAVWSDRASPSTQNDTNTTSLSSSAPNATSTNTTIVPSSKVIGGVRCRLEPSTDASPSVLVTHPAPVKRVLYVQTLVVLAPYRSLGVGAALLDAVVCAAVERYGVSVVSAHVWEKNEDALAWYKRRGFEVGAWQGEYYHRLRPRGAWEVRKRVDCAGTSSVVGCDGA
ncbi:MAG: hypothetical protein M1825_002548 [Sarcosagium campestre]|nr:MAG: hypothetical protein M1825_002548 [Sarcosagium campestre]